MFTHDFDYPNEKVNGHLIRISIRGAVVSRIENSATGKEMFSWSSSPSCHRTAERIWQERRFARDVPSLLVKAVLAVEDDFTAITESIRSALSAPCGSTCAA
jgi:hypothetical protein